MSRFTHTPDLNVHGWDMALYPSQAAYIREWVVNPMSQPTVCLKVEALSRAFGLGERYVISYLFAVPGMSFGGHLVKEIVAWVDYHYELSANNPEYYETFFAGLKLD